MVEACLACTCSELCPQDLPPLSNTNSKYKLQCKHGFIKMEANYGDRAGEAFWKEMLEMSLSEEQGTVALC